MRKLMLLAAAGAGYVLGAKAGRQRYESIKSTVMKVKENPTVQERAHQVADVAKEQAPVMKEKIAEAAGMAAAKIKPGSANGSEGSGGPADQLNPDSTVHQGDKAYPRGDLP